MCEIRETEEAKRFLSGDEEFDIIVNDFRYMVFYMPW